MKKLLILASVAALVVLSCTQPLGNVAPDSELIITDTASRAALPKPPLAQGTDVADPGSDVYAVSS